MTTTRPQRQLGLPTWEIDTLRITRANSVDELGRRWVVSKHPDGETGWTGAPATRTQRSDRPFGPGQFRSAAYRKEREIGLTGTVWCPDEAIREQTEVELASLCSDPGRLYTYRRRTETYDQTADVELNDAVLLSVMTPYRLDWSLAFVAPDPRKHDYAWQEPQSTVATPGSFGLDFSGGGLDFSGGGLDFGTPAVMSVAKVANYGTAPAYPVFELTGQLSSPAIVHLETGARLTYADAVALGETITINCDDFPQRNQPGKTCLSTARGNVRSLLTIGTTWPVVDPGEVATFQLQAAPGVAGGMRSMLRSAYW